MPRPPVRAKERTECAELKPAGVQFARVLFGRHETSDVRAPVWNSRQPRVDRHDNKRTQVRRSRFQQSAFLIEIQRAALCFLMPGGERYPLAIVETIRRARVSVLHFVPSMLNVFLEYLDAKPSSVRSSFSTVRHVFASGEALAPAHVRKFNDLVAGITGARLINLYGPTEATVDVTYFDCPAEGNVDRIPIGRPIDNMRLYVLRDGRQVPIGETGELCIAGVGLARGYLNNPGLTAEKFTDNPANPGERIYRTGDVARWLPDGNVEYLGRDDNQVKIRGLRIELGEIENAIREHPGVADAVAVVRRPSEAVAMIIAYIVCRHEIDLASLKRRLKEVLPEYMIPNQFEKIDAIPLTPSGKADRKALPEPTVSAAQSTSHAEIGSMPAGSRV